MNNLATINSKWNSFYGTIAEEQVRDYTVKFNEDVIVHEFVQTIYETMPDTDYMRFKDKIYKLDKLLGPLFKKTNTN